jgi:hypothetical protein
VTALLVWDRGLGFGIEVGATSLASSTLAILPPRARPKTPPFVERFRGRLDGDEGGSVFGVLFAVAVAAFLAWRLVREGTGSRAVLAALALAVVTWLLRRRPRPSLAVSSSTFEPEPASSGVPAALPPFPVRLRRELSGLAVFFALASLALTAFFAWI